MEIKAKTLLDKIYDNALILVPITVAVLFTLSLIIGQYISVQEKNANLVKKATAYKKNLDFKLSAIKRTPKPPLVCKKGISLTGNDYDMVQIKNTYFIATDESIIDPSKALKLDDCEVYSHVTNSIIPKPIVPVNEKLKAKIITLNNTMVANEEAQKLKELKHNEKYKHYDFEKNEYVITLQEANRNIKELKAFVSEQDIEIDRLRLVEAKYNEIKGLLGIVLEKKNLHVRDLLIQPKKVSPKPKKIVVTKKIKAMEDLKVEIEAPTAISIASQSEHIQRILYTIRYLTQSMKSKQDEVPSPSQKDLKVFKVSKSQLKNFKGVSRQLLQVIDRLASAKERNFNIYNKSIRNSITLNVGI